MRLKTMFTAVIAMITIGTLAMPVQVEAKRFGGGSSVGKQSSGMQRQAAQPQRPPQQQAQGQAQPGQAQAAAAQRPAASGASRWLGPLAGLAAGGLLAALLFGDGFEGLQIMDFMLILLLVVGGFMLFRFLRRQAGRPAMAPAGAGAYQRGAAIPPASRSARPSPLHAGMGTRSGPAAGDDDAPAWFDDAGFVEGAKSHFIRLQASWDHADFTDLRAYTTPELFAELQREREKTQGPQSTEVVRLDAELVGVLREGDLVVASILFSGLIREEEHGPADAFREIWHVQHRWDSPAGDWLIAGIQQVADSPRS
ncbi:MAG: Tim44 domain-containing protein [Sphingobacteriia bacterium]|nr:Tim44 domain-containing protein [Sphingobacteriia bacterium]NCC39238.1 Tim44 domain-containing protein [Gammaproteobacteria bacterium]